MMKPEYYRPEDERKTSSEFDITEYIVDIAKKTASWMACLHRWWRRGSLRHARAQNMSQSSEMMCWYPKPKLT